MSVYYDSGVLLKLYTDEEQSAAVRSFVTERGEPMRINQLHRTECTTAFRLKAFRKECDGLTAGRAVADFEDDIATGVLRLAGMDWDVVWEMCRVITDAHAVETGCRTLDALHVACARAMAIRSIVTSDRRQVELARRMGMEAITLY